MQAATIELRSLGNNGDTYSLARKNPLTLIAVLMIKIIF
jgi:hypothetical protein